MSDASLRLQQEALEARILHPKAARSAESLGRERAEAECFMRPAFQRDRDRILHSKAFRRLKHKTQVFIAPEGDHYRTRLTHTLEVGQIARTIARALRLNEDLVEAIAMGHDLGHTPFGHAGEAVLDGLLPAGFAHNEQSVRVCSLLEPMNLTREVLDGILHHTGPGVPCTLEGQIVKIADRVAYLNHDIDDAIRAGILKPASVPVSVRRRFGETKGERIERMVLALVTETAKDYAGVRMSEPDHEVFLKLRQFMFKRVYTGSKAKYEEGKVAGVIEGIYRVLRENPALLPPEVAVPPEADEPTVIQAVADYIAGMTDRYALSLYEKLYLPRAWRLTDQSA